jgi:hypothetical protein
VEAAEQVISFVANLERLGTEKASQEVLSVYSMAELRLCTSSCNNGKNDLYVRQLMEF